LLPVVAEDPRELARAAVDAGVPADVALWGAVDYLRTRRAQAARDARAAESLSRAARSARRRGQEPVARVLTLAAWMHWQHANTTETTKRRPLRSWYERIDWPKT